MCGLAGIFAPDSQASLRQCEQMIAAIAHRGPDDFGIETFDAGRVALGHRRLAILDLSPLGHQPMSSADRRYAIVYNGEIYNFREIRSELEAGGAVFKSESDTEVILAAYARWGVDAVSRFRGMFAFALWDASRGELVLCRDRFGVKPLYYSLRGRRLVFGSELKALDPGGRAPKDVDAESLAEFLQFGYVSPTRCIYGDIAMVPPGGVVTINRALRVESRAYWQVQSLFDPQALAGLRAELGMLGDEALLDRVENVLAEAFDYRMVADVPVGIFLSGGIDSSLVAALLARRGRHELRTFTIGFGDSEYDESRYARVVAQTLGARHIETQVAPELALQTVDRLNEIFDEPVGNASAIPTLIVSEVARRDVKVALSADGADELFGGYARYHVVGRYASALESAARFGYFASAEILDALPPTLTSRLYTLTRLGGAKFAGINDKIRKFVRMARARDVAAAYEAAVSEWPADAAKALMGEGRAGAARPLSLAQATSDRERFMLFDASRYLSGDLLMKIDRTSMAVSLETREPFLDHEAARVAVALPMHWKIRDGRGKYVLRRLLERHLPAGLFDRPKQGFTSPTAAWLRGPLRASFEHSLSPPQVKHFGLLDPAGVSRAVKEFLEGRGMGSPAGLWCVYQLQRWAERWLAAPPARRAVTNAGLEPLRSAVGQS
jgi:asparagine synthase (glutamine-hydrolysing)